MDGNTCNAMHDVEPYNRCIRTTAEKDLRKKGLLQHEDDMPVPNACKEVMPLYDLHSESEVTTASKMTIRIWIFNEGTREGHWQGRERGIGL